MLVPVLSGTRSPPPPPAGPRVQEARRPGCQTHTRWRAHSILPSAHGFGGSLEGSGRSCGFWKTEFVVLVPVGTGKLQARAYFAPNGQSQGELLSLSRCHLQVRCNWISGIEEKNGF